MSWVAKPRLVFATIRYIPLLVQRLPVVLPFLQIRGPCRPVWVEVFVFMFVCV